jgi:hypothetical protein
LSKWYVIAPQLKFTHYPLRFLLKFYESAGLRSSTGIQPQKVIVEWYYFDAKWGDDELKLANERVEGLSQQFSVGEKPKNLPVLDCIGWVKHPNKSDRALLYSLPPELHVEGLSNQPVSLLELLTATPSGGQVKQRPSLASRFRLAAALATGFLELHTVEWLHKSFNSHNVLLFKDSDGKISFAKPFITGFDFARPDGPGQVSLSMRSSPLDLYRHPELRKARPPSALSKTYMKQYDIYSLGLVLFEVGMWTRLDEYTKPNLSPEDFRRRILGYVERDLPLWMGDRFRRAVETCLSGDYLEQLDAVPLDTIESGEDECGGPEAVAPSYEMDNLTQLGSFYRRVVAELGHCQCGMGDEV